MELVVEKKFLEGTWWKYGLLLAGAKLSLWVALVYHWNPQVDWGAQLGPARVVYLSFIAAAFLPFVAGRLQLRTLFWFALVGFFFGEAAYLFLDLAQFGARFNLLPYVSFMQLYVTAFGLGAIVETGRYVFRKLAE